MANYIYEPSTWYTWTNTATTTNTVQLWNNWVSSGTTTASVAYTNTWSYWLEGYATSGVTRPDSNFYVAPQLTPDQLAEQQRQREERELAAAVERGRRAEAAMKARALLLEELDAEQAAEFAAKNHFHVRVRTGRGPRSRERLFRIRGNHYAGNVEELNDEGQRIASYCIHMRSDIPTEDHLVAQKLLLESDVESFERIANISRYVPGRVVHPDVREVAA
jgi:hypothetical protein